MIYMFYKMLMFKMLNMNECIFLVWMCVWGGGGGVLMFKMLNMNECIFWCECVCVMGGGIAFIMSLQLLINSVWKCRLI